MTRITRTGWGARPARPGPGNLDKPDVIGIALHWPAMTKPLRGIAPIGAALRAWQNYHMDTHGWSDIAYQEAIDQDGNVYSLRGIRGQSGANGDGPVNEHYGALLLILAPGEKPTPHMLDAVRDRIARHRQIFPNSHLIVGHNAIRPEATACPGPIVTGAIAAGDFEPRKKAKRGAVCGVHGEALARGEGEAERQAPTLVGSQGGVDERPGGR